MSFSIAVAVVKFRYQVEDCVELVLGKWVSRENAQRRLRASGSRCTVLGFVKYEIQPFAGGDLLDVMASHKLGRCDLHRLVNFAFELGRKFERDNSLPLPVGGSKKDGLFLLRDCGKSGGLLFLPRHYSWIHPREIQKRDCAHSIG